MDTFIIDDLYLLNRFTSPGSPIMDTITIDASLIKTVNINIDNNADEFYKLNGMNKNTVPNSDYQLNLVIINDVLESLNITLTSNVGITGNISGDITKLNVNVNSNLSGLVNSNYSLSPQFNSRVYNINLSCDINSSNLDNYLNYSPVFENTDNYSGDMNFSNSLTIQNAKVQFNPYVKYYSINSDQPGNIVFTANFTGISSTITSKISIFTDSPLDYNLEQLSSQSNSTLNFEFDLETSQSITINNSLGSTISNQTGNISYDMNIHSTTTDGPSHKIIVKGLEDNKVVQLNNLYLSSNENVISIELILDFVNSDNSNFILNFLQTSNIPATLLAISVNQNQSGHGNSVLLGNTNVNPTLISRYFNNEEMNKSLFAQTFNFINNLTPPPAWKDFTLNQNISN